MSKNIKMFFKKTTIWLVIFAITAWSFGTPFFNLVPTAHAAITITTQPIEMISSGFPPTTVKASSVDTAIAKFSLGQSALETLSSVAVTIADANGGDLASGDITNLKVYKDNGDGLFSSGTDSVAGTQTTVNIGSVTTITTDSNNSLGATESPSTFFITMSSAAGWSDTSTGNALTVSMATDGGVVVTSANPPVVVTALTGTNILYADTTAPTVIGAEMMNSNTIDVIYSEPIDFTTATTTTNYTISGGLTVTEAFMEGPDLVRIRTNADATSGVTTIAVNTSVLDIAGNSNSDTANHTVETLVKVVISEFSAEYNASDDEFVELYNPTGSSVDIAGWKLQYSVPGTIAWTDVATIAGGTNLLGYSYHLIATDGVGVVADTAIGSTGNFPLAGGHIRLFDTSKEIDRIGWGTATQPEGTVKTAHIRAQSFERKTFGQVSAIDMATGGPAAGMGNGWDTDNNNFDLVTQTSPLLQNAVSAIEEPDFSAAFGGNGPFINHMPINNAPTGGALVLRAEGGDPMTPPEQVNAKIYYMRGDGTPSDNVVGDYSIISGVFSTNSFFEFTIPQVDIDHSNTTTNGLYYYIKFTTNSGTSYMSSSPTANMAKVEADVAKAPFIINCGAAGTTYAITGTVIGDDTNPIEAVNVFVEGTGFYTSTAFNGTYTLNVPNGSYDIGFFKDGYFPAIRRDVFVNGAANALGNRTLSIGEGGGMTGDSNQPFVSWSNPGNGMSGVPPNNEEFEFFIGFSENLTTSTFVSDNVYFTIDGNNPIVASSIVYDTDSSDNAAAGYPVENNLGIIGAPDGGFLPDTTYFLVLTDSVRDEAGNSLSGNRADGGEVISFTTGGNFTEYVEGGEDWVDYGKGGMIAPFVRGINPFNGAVGIAPNAKMSVEFSTRMDSASIATAGNIKLKKVVVTSNAEVLTDIAITSTLNTNGDVAIVTPTENLIAGKYRLIITGALKSADGVWMGDPTQAQNVATYDFFDTHFEVGANVVADTIAPTIKGTWPSNGESGIAVNPGPINIQFSEAMDPSTITANTITLKRGSSTVNANVEYDPNYQAATINANVVLATDTIYTITVVSGASGVKDMAGVVLDTDYLSTFTTGSSGDSSAPSLMFANGDDYMLAVTFSESVKSANITDSVNWASSVLNPNNYIIKWGNPGDVVDSGTVIDISAVGSRFKYEPDTNTVMIKDLGLDDSQLSGKDFYINMSPDTVSGTGVTDLSGNLLAGSVTFQMPIGNSEDNKGMLGPGMSGGTGGMMGPDMKNMGMMMAGVFPMNGMAGQTSMYFVDIPTVDQVPIGGSIVLTFPQGFNVANAAKDTFSPVNNDINEWNDGIVTIASVTGNQNQRTVTIVTAGSATNTNDFLHMDLKDIVNTSVPRGPETGGYTVDMKTLDASGNLLENISGMPFFISEGGDKTLTVTVNGVTSGDNGDVYVFLGSPMTGPMEKKVTFTDATTVDAVFSNLPAGEYHLFTEPMFTLGVNDYAGKSMPEPITIGNNPNTKTITLAKEAAGAGKKTVTVNITGVFGTDDIDVFAGSSSTFKVKTLVNAGTNPTATLYLPDGDWMVGMGPAMPKGPMSGPPPMPDWMPPMPINVKITGSGAVAQENSGTANDGTLAITVGMANKNIIGYVMDNTGNAIADADVWAYQPMGTAMGSNTRTDRDGKFTLKVADNGTYTVGTFKPGLPNVPEKTVTVVTQTEVVDANATADVYINGNLVTDVVANRFVIKIKKPEYTISGKVTNGTNAMSYAPVWAYQENGYGHADTMTDATGNYIIYVDNGTWTVNAHIPGYGDASPTTVVVNGSDITQNIVPDTSLTYYTISGTVGIDTDGTYSTVEDASEYLPIRAVKYNAQGVYLGNEYGAMTDENGNYSISVPAGIYRVDIWTPEYGEVDINNLDDDNTLNEVADDDYVNNPANVNVTAGNVANADIIFVQGDLKTITLSFANAVAGQEGFLNFEGVSFPDGVENPPRPNGSFRHVRIPDLANPPTVTLNPGDYTFFLDIPGVGNYIPNPSTGVNGRDATKDVIVVTVDRTVAFTLPDLEGATFATITGTIYDSSEVAGNELENAWVWIGNPTIGYHHGTQTNSSGVYTLNVPVGNGYDMGVDKPGYIAGAPIDLDVTVDIANQDFILNSFTQNISGYIYADANTDGNYDVGEEVANGFVKAISTDGGKENFSPVDGTGYYEIGVLNGNWNLYGVGDGYQETKLASSVTINNSNSIVNIPLTVNDNWTHKSKKKPMTPASGGTLDDTSSGGTGVKVTVPPNALGSSSSSGNINVTKTTSVVNTKSSKILGGEGVRITATDSSGQSITILNDYIDVEIVKYKTGIVADLATGSTTEAELKSSDMGYWDNSIENWVSIPTTTKAYYKEDGDTDWKLYSDTEVEDNFDAFVDTIDTGDYEDFKLVYIGKTNHLTDFGTTTEPDNDPPIAPVGGTATASNGSVSLTWTANSETDISDYTIHRGSTTDFTPNDSNKLNSSTVSTNSYTDSSVSANTSYTYYYKLIAMDSSTNPSPASSAITASYSYTAPSSSSGGGGGGGVYFNYTPTVTVEPTNMSATTTTTTINSVNNSFLKNTVEVVEKTVEKVTDKIVGIIAEAALIVEGRIESIVIAISGNRSETAEAATVSKYVKPLLEDVKEISDSSEIALSNFITYGTSTTLKLGAGERAGVINSYKAAFYKLPVTETEWSDAIKIANGRWPTERDEQSEINSKAAFKKIYLRDADMDNPNDNAAVTVMAYGLRPANRNLDSEKVAIKSFKHIYGYYPLSASAWDVVRAIAYSGATR